MTELATFGAGCFWGVQQLFDRLDGVVKTEVGYMGGRTDQPTYREVCTDTTGHAEVVHIEFTPDVISYEALVDYFWRLHDPTQLNRQGVDEGSQYRSVIFTHNDDQIRKARESKEQISASGRFDKPVVTEIVPAGRFWPAEEYHQKYFAKRGLTEGCHVLHW